MGHCWRADDWRMVQPSCLLSGWRVDESLKRAWLASSPWHCPELTESEKELGSPMGVRDVNLAPVFWSDYSPVLPRLPLSLFASSSPCSFALGRFLFISSHPSASSTWLPTSVSTPPSTTFLTSDSCSSRKSVSVRERAAIGNRERRMDI